MMCFKFIKISLLLCCLLNFSSATMNILDKKEEIDQESFLMERQEDFDDNENEGRVYLYSTSDTDITSSPLYMSSSTSVKELNTFTPVAECSRGLWTFYSGRNFSGKYKGYNPYGSIKCGIFHDGISSARLHGNTTEITQQSVTFYSQDQFLGLEDGPYFRNMPQFNGTIVSLVLTGINSALRLFTKNYFGGLEFCVSVPKYDGFIGGVIDNVPHRTGFPPDVFKSFILAPACLERIANPNISSRKLH